jgi:iron complex outermembrane receptor protein
MTAIHGSMLRIAIGTALALAAGAAHAQQSGGPQSGNQASGSLLEEVTVTAQRREEAVQTVPLAVSAFSDVQLERLNITQTLDLVKLIPNMIGSNNTGLGTANVYSIRALNNTESIATFDPPVGSYVDDVFIARQNANNFAFFDVDRVEVLRGPQGTLFGRNTTGGAVNVILKKPGTEFGGFAEVGVGAFGGRMARLSVDMPLSDTVLTKLSGYYTADDGYVDNPVTLERNLNDKANYGVRAAVRWLASDSVTWDIAGDYQRSDQMNIQNNVAGEIPTTGAVTQYTCNTGVVGRSRFSCTGLRTDRANLAGYVVGKKADLPLGNEVVGHSLTSNLELDTSLGAVNFITGWRDMRQQFSLDFFNGKATSGLATGPTGAFVISNDGRHRQFTQEVKLSGKVGTTFDYVAGVYYFKEKNRTDFADVFTLALAPGVYLPLVLEDRVLDNTSEAYAVYTQWDWHLTDRFTATLGARWTDEKEEIDYTPNVNSRITAPPSQRISTANIEARGIPTEQSTSLLTPRFALKYQFTDDLMGFASATRGFKSGGWNARATAGPNGPAQIQPFTEEKVWSYELGLRSEWFDKRLRANITGFSFEAEDFQLPSAFVNPNGSITFITQNFATLENQGVEIELIAAPIDALNVFATIGIQDAKYKDLDPSIVAQQQRCQAALASNNPTLRAANCGLGIVDPSGNIAQPVRAPDTYVVGANYTIQLTPSLTLTPTATIKKTGAHSIGTSDTPISLVDSNTRWDAGLTLEAPDQGWTLTANCTNCSSRDVRTSVLAELPYYLDPRTWSLNFKMRF